MSIGADPTNRDVCKGAGERLVLVLDLDHTLLNSVGFHELSANDAIKLERRAAKEEGKPGKELHRLDIGMWTKLRPFALEFLEAVHEMYDLHVYTMGEKNYAEEMRRILDPRRRLFGSITSKNESTSQSTKHLDVVATYADERMVAILDDTEEVWPHHYGNLIQIDRYHFFPASLRHFKLSGSSLLDMDLDESASNGMLAVSLRVLRTVHARFFDKPSHDVRDVRDIIGQLRGEILQGCSIMFGCRPSRTRLWNIAEALGATCSVDFDASSTTHVVVLASKHAEKIVTTVTARTASDRGAHVVSPRWLRACYFRWERVDERHFTTTTGPSS